jgi:hypothetical protein
MQLHGVITFTLHLIVGVAYDSVGMSFVKRTSALNQPLSLRIACTRAVFACGMFRGEARSRRVRGAIRGVPLRAPQASPLGAVRLLML